MFMVSSFIFERRKRCFEITVRTIACGRRTIAGSGICGEVILTSLLLKRIDGCRRRSCGYVCAGDGIGNWLGIDSVQIRRESYVEYPDSNDPNDQKVSL